MTPDPAWLERLIGTRPNDPGLFARALTHSSVADAPSYERLEFLGDRVLGLNMAAWLYELFPDEPEGKLSRRFNALVDGATCAEIARELGIPGQLRLGKQARDDGAADSDNVLGDVTEALLGALWLDQGADAARALVRRAWADHVDTRERAPRHPKSALQEWAAANRCKPPVYTLEDRSGPQHAPVFRVRVEVPNRAAADATGTSKQEAETAAAKALLEKLA
ncbi:ribonuclease III [Sphingomonas jatrophae]|uniref:Ribonuclease 3 n=1 Tax=Sphingomonas jatrophae TaxID=1166337 RepID=A0A1I6M639_9SPHN|nr:ribonuclease III [Sphingomonas jatrophae]SFS11068.1 RNAse III [Sphingomonas jatrophae]